ncbi:glycosyl hydrolase [Okibacterium fritillariae]|uniref:Alpha-L-rhamnosidase n=1 Tax=Okibacterium fritillariae TaxID=123320 RepID=A0A1T5KVP6_9MICO|nr:glycosyl hydrolase [Okibacterium fritillariae]SKC67846.1 alpha-L-rhamnosidase [Okibacterium fritillariae]
MTPSRAPHLTRRQLIGYTAAASMGAAIAATAARGAAGQAFGAPVVSAAAAPSAASFATPPASVAPKFRWWWPNGEVEIDEIVREVNQVADAGFGGLEIADVHHSVPKNLLDVKNFGWGSPRWLAAVEAALVAAEKRGITLDVTLGPSWPAALPNITPQSVEALTEVAHGLAEVPAGGRFNAALPEPVVAASAGVTEKILLKVHAAKILTKPTRGQIVLQRSSLVDLTNKVTNGSLDWTAPSGASDELWVLLAYWRRGSGQEAEGGPHTSPTAYVVDHFSQAGAQAVIDYWEANIVTPRVKDLLTRAGGSFFEDSLEIETHSTIWTRTLVEEFQKRMGYDLLPWLPVIIEQKEKYLYDFDDVKNMRVRDDYNQVLSDLYTENHLVPLRDWAHRLGLTYRVQAYGLEQDSIQQAGIVDIPETESLGAKNLDDYRVLASGRDIAGHTILSCEAAAFLGKAYNTTWTQVLNTLNETFAGGVNQTVLHGFPYATAPGLGWPGFAAFSPYYNNAVGYSEAWGPRTPNWAHARDISAFVARTQQVLQTGRARYDILFLRQKGWAQTGIGAPWATASGIPIGWTHGFLANSSLELPGAVMKNGRFAPDGGNYRVVILDIDRFRGNEATMSVAAATKLLAHAKAGLPVIFFGDWTNPEATGLRDASANQQVASLLAQVKALPTSTTALGNDDIPIALAALGIGRDVEHSSSMLKHIRRVDGKVDYYFLTNTRHNPPKDKLVLIDQDVWLTAESGDSIPYELDAWTGRITPVAHYRREGSRVRVRVRLAPAQSTIIVLAGRSYAGVTAPLVHVVETTATGARFAAGAGAGSGSGSAELVAEATGTYQATLSDGRTKTVTVKDLPAAIDLPSWQLELDDWQPVDPARIETKHVMHTIALDSLQPWNKIPGVVDASGIGVYKTTLTLDPASWKIGRVGIYLDLGQVIDTFKVWVNSELVAERDILDTRLDISAYARPGRNTVRVEVASTLINRLRVVNPTVYSSVGSQAYGLLGPVQVRPYGIARVI